MVVLILECVPTGLRGQLTRWMLEPKTGVFVGRVSAMVRDRLWDKVCAEADTGGCVMVHTCNSEQGYEIKCSGKTSRTVVDFEGLQLVRVP